MQLFYILVTLGVFCTDVINGACDPKAAEILGGNYTLLRNGTALKYECSEGKYPYPTEFWFCNAGGEWRPLNNVHGRRVDKAICQDIPCPKPAEFENGEYEPHQDHYNVNHELRFHCYQGYTLRGSQIRTCLPNGKWSGETTICDDEAGQCPNPGIPIGARKDSTMYESENRVRYSCDRGLTLMGSKERICQKSGTWSGSEPECRTSFTFDTADDVSTKFTSSLAEVAASVGPNGSVSSMSIYIVLGASRSIGDRKFKEVQNAVLKLIEKVSSYDISPSYGIITFATDSKVIVSTTDPQSSNATWVTEQVERMTYNEHKMRRGSNISKGLRTVYSMMVNKLTNEQRQGLRPTPITITTHHVVTLLTDGNYNMGGDPVPVIAMIKDLLEIDDYLDVYVFGIGPNANMAVINGLASQKPGERHSFILRDYENLQAAFDKMIGESQTLSWCGLAEGHKMTDDQQKYPWHATITIRRAGRGHEHCKGALISQYYVLTAAHCFTVGDNAEQITVRIGNDYFGVAALQSHPEYNIDKLQDLGIPEFYDYDIALVKLAQKVTFSANARPICLPCTVGTTHALRKPLGQTTCKDHEEEILPPGNIAALFVTRCAHRDGRGGGLQHQSVRIKNGEKKLACEEDAKKASHYINVTDASQVVTEHFLCTGGVEPQVDPNTCKNDVGGPLIIQKRLRYIQVGVISWSVVDSCKNKEVSGCESDNGHPKHTNLPYARDFHINIFKILPWLKEQLIDEDLVFL